MLQVSQRGSTPRLEGLHSPGQVYSQRCLGSSMSRPVQDLSNEHVSETKYSHGVLRNPLVVSTIIDVLNQIRIWGIGAL